MIRVGIIGGAGYTAGELLRILLHHPEVQIEFVHSNSNAGNLVSDVHADLLGESFLVFTDELQQNVDALFLCMGHGKSKTFLEKNPIDKNIKIIDLSRDYRLKVDAQDFVYGLPELNKAAIQSTNHLANPGCFATAIQLAVLPLAKAGLLTNDLHVNAITGSTGAGQKPAATTHFSWRNNNVSVYKAFKHQHLDEIYQSVQQLQPSFEQTIHFIPVRGNFSRGIFANVYTDCTLTEAEAIQLYQSYYKGDPFVFITKNNPNLKQIVNTNKCIIYLEKHGDKLLIVSMIDNLVKGASGQAIQNMNLMFGLAENVGLGLKAVAF
ncbi:MAG: N-acetyl-gamma-glutamyl-phosphate reductase [Bacteroidota bacterium]